MMADNTTIAISKKFQEWLKNKGKKGEKYEDIIRRLVNYEFELDFEEKADDEEGIKKNEDLNVETKNQLRKRREIKEKENKEERKRREDINKKQERQKDEELKIPEDERKIRSRLKKRISEVFGMTEENEEKE